MSKRLLLIAALLLTVPAQAQSFDRILAAAAEREAARSCSEGADEIVVCGDRDRGDRFRLPLPTVREVGEQGAVVGEVPPPSVENPFLSGCGMFRGQRRCSKREAEGYGYGRGRDPLTLVGRLVTVLVDPDAEIGPPATVPPRNR
ncbi:hypothetical protein ACFQ15_09200 [Sphingomonas hankookensis]|uniref:hypothetical protein n=1 Tax=Sphingomonas hankookensis TaxID=563996 RepID=UPI001F5923D3|nr:hypothetical protein [Sphingomonas hankookensis]